MRKMDNIEQKIAGQFKQMPGPLGRNYKKSSLLSDFDCKRHFFKELLGPVQKVAQQYNFDPNYLLAVSALESG